MRKKHINGKSGSSKPAFIILAVILAVLLAVGCGKRGSDIIEEDTAESEAGEALQEDDEDSSTENPEETGGAEDESGEAEDKDSKESEETAEEEKDAAAEDAKTGKKEETAENGDTSTIAAEPLLAEELPPEDNGILVAIDPGHQEHGNSEQEPIGPGASTTKPKVASGTSGSASGLNEYELNLIVSLQLRDELKTRGYKVLMIRETHDVNISNSERAKMANEAGADILVRIHANGSDDSSVHGALCYEPSSANQFLSQDVIEKSQTLSRDIIDSFCSTTGAKNLGTLAGDDMTGINWSEIPVTIVEMGFMSNPDEDLSMAQPEYQNLMVQGIADGIDEYFMKSV